MPNKIVSKKALAFERAVGEDQKATVDGGHEPTKSPPRIGLATSFDQKIPRRSIIRFPLTSLRHHTFVAQSASSASSYI
jgi:hypothetical protein